MPGVPFNYKQAIENIEGVISDLNTHVGELNTIYQSPETYDIPYIKEVITDLVASWEAFKPKIEQIDITVTYMNTLTDPLSHVFIF